MIAAEYSRQQPQASRKQAASKPQASRKPGQAWRTCAHRSVVAMDSHPASHPIPIAIVQNEIL
jgi:hypothetical protein